MSNAMTERVAELANRVNAMRDELATLIDDLECEDEAYECMCRIDDASIHLVRFANGLDYATQAATPSTTEGKE